MKALDYFRKLFKREKDSQSNNLTKIEEVNGSVTLYDDVYTHAFDRPSKKKFAGIHRVNNRKDKQIRFKKVKSNNEDELTM